MYLSSIKRTSKRSQQQSKQNHNEYWGAFLGLGGEILEDDESPIDSSIEFCKEHYQESNWLDTDDINLEEPDCYLLCCLDDENYTSAQYFTFSSMTEAKEFCYQFAKENYPDEDLQFKENSFYHEDGHKAVRIDYIYGNSFEVNYIFSNPYEKKIKCRFVSGIMHMMVSVLRSENQGLMKSAVVLQKMIFKRLI